MHASKRVKQSTILPSYNTYEPHQQPIWHDNPKGTVVALNLGSNQQLSKWTQDLLNKSKFMLGTGNLTNYSVIVK